MLIRAAYLIILMSCGALAQIQKLSDVRSICAEGILSKNFEANEVLAGILNDYYQSFERQFREQAERAAKVEFFYDGTAGNKAAILFKIGHTVAYANRGSKCNAEISSVGEIQALSPHSFRVTITLLVNRLLTEQESHLSEAEKSNRAMIWKYKNTSPPFAREKLDYTAHGEALKAAFAMASAK